MSHQHLAPVRQEDDEINGVAVFLIITAAVLFGLLCVFVSWILWRSNLSTFQPVAQEEERPARPEVGPPVIWGVNQTLINVDTATRHLIEESARKLEEFRWIDEEEGIAQIPIGEAMRAIVTGGVVR